MMRCMIVDDDEFSRTVIKQLVERTQMLELIAECEDAAQAFRVLKNTPIDVVFLDVEMPEMSGIELIKTLQVLPQVVLITSRMHYAVEAFEHSVTDYLIKPVKYARFLKAVERAEQNIALKSKVAIETVQTDDAFVFIKSDTKIVKLKLDEVHFIEALSDYIVFNTDTKKYVMHGTMKNIIEKLTTRFVRVHRSYIINIDKIESIEDTKISMPQKTIPIGASYRDDFLGKLHFLT